MMMTCSRRLPWIPMRSWLIAMAILFCRMAFALSSKFRRSLDMIRGAAIIAHRAIWERAWSTLRPKLPMMSWKEMSGVWYMKTFGHKYEHKHMTQKFWQKHYYHTIPSHLKAKMTNPTTQDCWFWFVQHFWKSQLFHIKQNSLGRKAKRFSFKLNHIIVEMALAIVTWRGWL